MNDAKIESKREMDYYKYRKSSIFEPYILEKKDTSNITEKITKRKYDKIFVPKLQTITSHQRYIDNLYRSDLNNPAFTPKKIHSKIKRNLYRNKSVNNPTFYKDILFRNLNETNKINKTTKNFFLKENSNNYDDKRLEILRTTTNHKVRSFYSRYSDIFNLKNNKPFNEENQNKTSIMKSRKKDKKNGSKKLEYLKQRIKPIEKKFYKTIKIPDTNIETKKNTRYNKIKSEREKEELLRKKVQDKTFHRKNLLKIDNIKYESMPTLYQTKIEINNKKTNLNNLESVNYNIINNKKSSKNEEYIKLSSIKPSFQKITNYEIKVPKNYAEANELKLKKILSMEGIHFFNFSEQGDLIGGNKGKFVFQIRNSNNDNKYNDTMKKINSKMSKMNVMLKKTNKNYLKKKTDLYSDVPKITRNTPIKKNKKEK